MAKRKDSPASGPKVGASGGGRQTPNGSAPPAVDTRPAEELDPDHRDAVADGMDQASRGQFATDDEIEALYGRAGL